MGFYVCIFIVFNSIGKKSDINLFKGNNLLIKSLKVVNLKKKNSSSVGIHYSVG